MPKLRERVEEWQTQITQLQTTIAELSSKLAAVEGRPNLETKVSELETALATAQQELTDLKASKPPEAPEAPKPPEAPEEPKPPTQEPSSRKQSLSAKLQRKGAAGPQGQEPKHREPRRKLNLI
jgi:chromosome segregation ATPase